MSENLVEKEIFDEIDLDLDQKIKKDDLNYYLLKKGKQIDDLEIN